MITKHTYLAWGPSTEARVVALGPHDVNVYLQACALGNSRGSDKFRAHAIEQAFGRGVTTIIPAWVPEALLEVVGWEFAPDLAKQLAAVILSGGTFERAPAPVAEEKRPARAITRGGKKVSILPPAPVGPRPGGAYIGGGA